MASLVVAVSASAAPTETHVVEVDGAFTLLRDGAPYRVLGVGGQDRLEELAAAGANSIRTWGVGDDTRELLDKAHELGLSVAVGLWLEPERRGVDYDDKAFVKKQHDMLLEQARSVMDHPAVLLWGVGNEMEDHGDRPVVFEAVNALAAAIKEMDPHHPTMTVLAELGEGNIKAEAVRDFCPDIDIVGINSYGGIGSVGDRYASISPAVNKPFIITEHGPLGHWETGKTDWGLPIEQTSTEKAEWYRNGYEATVLGHPDLALGSYAFLWGDKQETTSTWYGMFLTDGSRTPAVDTMQELWSGEAPSNRAPELVSLVLDGPAVVEPGATLTAKLEASDPEGDELEVEWVLRSASAGDGVGGDFEERLAGFPDAIVLSSDEAAAVKVPDEAGAYRLFAFVRDDHGGVATANIPLLARVAAAPLAAGDGADLPFRVDPEGSTPPWIPSGFMGDLAATTLEPTGNNPHSGNTCLAAAFTASGGWGGVVWQDPVNDWGDAPGGHDLRPAKKLVWWARGAHGGEKVKFGFGVLGADKKHSDSGSAETTVTLTDQWKEYELDVSGTDLSNIKTGFMFAVAGQGKPVRFFLDDIAYE